MPRLIQPRAVPVDGIDLHNIWDKKLRTPTASFPNRFGHLKNLKFAWWHLLEILHCLLGRAAVARKGALLWDMNASHGNDALDVSVSSHPCFSLFLGIDNPIDEPFQSIDQLAGKLEPYGSGNGQDLQPHATNAECPLSVT